MKPSDITYLGDDAYFAKFDASHTLCTSCDSGTGHVLSTFGSMHTVGRTYVAVTYSFTSSTYLLFDLIRSIYLTEEHDQVFSRDSLIYKFYDNDVLCANCDTSYPCRHTSEIVWHEERKS
jgi:hypothetical protein